MKFIKFGDSVVSLENICFIEKCCESVTITYHNKQSIRQNFSTQQEAKNKIEEIYEILKNNNKIGGIISPFSNLDAPHLKTKQFPYCFFQKLLL